MTTSRRELFRAMGAGAALIATAQASKGVAQPAAAPPAIDYGKPSDAEGAVKIVNFDLLEQQAKEILPPGRFAFMGPAGDGWTYRENRRAFNDYPIMPRRLQGVSLTGIDLKTTILGHELPFPMITCPMGGHGGIHVDAEVGTAGGTGKAGTLYVSSGAATKPMEDIAKATPGPKWFQIYMNRDMEINRWLVQRAKAAGFTAIVLTADALGPGQSDEFIRLGRPMPPGVPGNHDPKLGGKGNFIDLKRDLSFSDVTFLREASGLPVLVKGVVHPQDIKECLAVGAAGIWVSNHGGRQMDGVPASISMLRPAADEVAGRVPIVFDSGIRRGIDVFKAIAMGATVVGVGRPCLWGLACGGAEGVTSVYQHIEEELRSTMLLSGVGKVTDLKRDNIVLARA
jgi:lactate oxidase